MCCKSFWKRLITFCLAFGFGLFSSNTFVSTQTTFENKNVITNLNSTQKNCVSADESLKYQNLPFEEVTPFIPPEKEFELIIIPNEEEAKIKISKDKKDEPQLNILNIRKLQQAKKRKNKEAVLEISPKIEKSSNKIIIYRPLEHTSQYQVLLHKENCYESNERK